MNVSVIIPAYNAADTIGETLASLHKQIFLDWEAIVVNDGSTDDTIDVVNKWAAQDERILLVQQANGGANAARNAGMKRARFDWVLFLDADDWLLPEHLQRMTAVLSHDPSLDAVHCGWMRVALDGQVIPAEPCYESGDLFGVFARRPTFPPFACLMRRSIVEAIGGWDISFQSCQEWDLWQRFSRTGARFGVTHEALGHYRMRPGSISTQSPHQLLRDGLRVIRNGYTADPRVPQPADAHAAGLSANDFWVVQLMAVCWPAGLALGLDTDARPLLELVAGIREPGLDPGVVAESLFRAVPFGIGHALSAWEQLWPQHQERIRAFLSAFETHSGTPGLARRAGIILERLIVNHLAVERPFTIGSFHAVTVEITQPIADIKPPATSERLHCLVVAEGERLGTIELPVCAGLVPGDVIADAIAAEFAWPLLERFFKHTLCPQLRFTFEEDTFALWRDDLCLAEALPQSAQNDWAHLHNYVGWTLFLQELWGRAGWPNAFFYDATAVTETAVSRSEAARIEVDVTAELPDVFTEASSLSIVMSVGGAVVGIATVETEGGHVSAHAIRTAMTTAGGFELCRVAVREGLLGRPLTDPTSLRDRLVANCPTAPQSKFVGMMDMAESILTPGVVIGQHKGGIGSSASRRAVLPGEAISVLIRLAVKSGQPVVSERDTDDGDLPDCVIYAPDLLSPTTELSTPDGSESTTVRQSTPTMIFDRNYFEALFASEPDPWRYSASPYEQTKYVQTLEMIPDVTIERALEIGCAEGRFTQQLAERVENLLAADISQIALERARQRCAHLDNIRYQRLDLLQDPLPDGFDLIVCSEILYFMGDRNGLTAVAAKLAGALNPGGYLITAHANLVVDESDKTGYDWDLPYGAKVIGDTFEDNRRLQLVKALHTPLYRIQAWQRPLPETDSSNSPAPEIIEMPQPTPPPPRAAITVRWQGGNASRTATKPVMTERLPILMYHRIAPDGLEALSRYRVDPAAFEEQLRYLRDANFYSVTLDMWRRAVALKRPLPGRAVLFTFDDGYEDFFTYAWPLLKRYGFTATVFLVAGLVGQTNHWDKQYGEVVSLLDWEQIRELRAEGVQFGAHSLTHSPLTAVSHANVVQECAQAMINLKTHLPTTIPALAYPYGDTDPAIQHLTGACGYVYGLTCRQSLSSLNDSLLALPRLEIEGGMNLAQFIAKLNG